MTPDQVTRVLDVRIQIRNDTSTNWTVENPVLMKGEMGIETNTGLFKIGDGATPWNALPYGASPAITMTSSPTANDFAFLVGTLAIVNGERIYTLMATAGAPGTAVWKRVVTSEELEALGYGDMLKSQFATNPDASAGYVDKAVSAVQLANNRQVSITGDVVAAVVEFNGTQNITLNAALSEIAALAGGGTFIKVQVNSQGRVVGYEALLASDIPDLTLSKITDAGTAAGKNTGTAIGQVVVVGDDGTIDPALMPSLTITDVFVVDSEQDMLALNATQGDIALRTDTWSTWVLVTGEASVLSNWREIKTPLNGIQQVNGHTGPIVTLSTDDVAEGDNNLYHTAERVVAVMTTQASSILTDGDTIVHEHDMLILNGGNAAGH